MLKERLQAVRQRRPLVHCITNYVTVNDVANIILASGGSPIMADEPQEAAQITSGCTGLVLNMGTINDRRSEAYRKAGKAAQKLGHPIVLDPVGIGGSDYRREQADRLLSVVRPTLIRGNLSEILALAKGGTGGHGVDVSEADRMEEKDLVRFLKKTAGDMQCILCVTGETDYVADDSVCYVLHNGRAEMSRITGTGCMLTGLLGSFLSANPEHPVEAAAAAVAVMGLAGEIGYSHLAPYEGNATYRNRLIDAVYNMDEETLEKGVRYEIQ